MRNLIRVKVLTKQMSQSSQRVPQLKSQEFLYQECLESRLELVKSSLLSKRGDLLPIV